MTMPALIVIYIGRSNKEVNGEIEKSLLIDRRGEDDVEELSEER